MTATTAKPEKGYRWCDRCRRSFAPTEVVNGACPVCGGPTRSMGRLQAIARGIMSNELAAPDIRTKHRQLVRLIWTRNGMGQQYYRVMAPDLSYAKFEARVTELLCAGATEGWVRFVLPPAPSMDENEYRMEFLDEERFLAELEAAFADVVLHEDFPTPDAKERR